MLLDELTATRPAAADAHAGHKRNTALADYLKALRADLDITEIDGFDDLHAPEGALLDGMRRAARLWGAGRKPFSCERHHLRPACRRVRAGGGRRAGDCGAQLP